MRRTIVTISLLLAAACLAASAHPATAISTGPLSANPDPVTFATEAVGISTPTQTVTLTNNGTQTLTISSITESGPFSDSGTTCLGTPLTVGGSCTVQVSMTPTGPGAQTGSLQIQDDDTTDGDVQNLDLSGTAVAQPVTATPTTLTFPAQRVGTQSAAQSVSFTNQTGYPYQVVPSTNPSGGPFSVNGCGAVVSAGASCLADVIYQPQSTGSDSGSVQVGSASFVNLSGTGIAPAANITPGTLSFGNQPVTTASAVQTLRLQNTGTDTLVYQGISGVTGQAGDYSISDAACAAAGSLSPTGSCAITVQFVPTQTGQRQATLNIHTDAGPLQVPLSGTGTPSAVSASPASVTFPNPITAGLGSQPQMVTIRNTSSDPLPITLVSLAGSNPKSFVRHHDTCSRRTLAPSGTCTIDVTFAPTAGGRRTALLDIADTGPHAPHVHTVTLTGTATYPSDAGHVTGAAGCTATSIRWTRPDMSGFGRVLIVRNHRHVPASPADGTIVAHMSGLAADTGLRRSTTYHYRVFATYHSTTRTGGIILSLGVVLRLRTGEICTPQHGSRTASTTPDVSWLAVAGARAYGIWIKRDGATTAYKQQTRHLSLAVPAGRLAHRTAYLLTLFVFTSSHPRGTPIATTTFTTR